MSQDKIDYILSEHFFTSGDLFRRINYIPELKNEIGCFSSAILFSQLEYWFLKMLSKTGKQTFYKTLSDKTDPNSWANELYFTEREYRYAFDRIGVRYTSLTEYMEAQRGGNPFRNKDGKEMYYLSYVDRKAGNKIYYLRNKNKIKELMGKVLDFQNKKEDYFDKQLTLLSTTDTQMEPAPYIFDSDSFQSCQHITGDYQENKQEITQYNIVSETDTAKADDFNHDKKRTRRSKLKLKQEQSLIEDKEESKYPKRLIPKNKPEDLDNNQYGLYSESLKLLYDHHIEDMKSQNKQPNKFYLCNTNDEHIRNERFILKELIKRINNDSILTLVQNHFYKMKTDPYYAKSAYPSKITDMYDKGRLTVDEILGSNKIKTEKDKLKELAEKDPISELFPAVYEMLVRSYITEGPRAIYVECDRLYKNNLPDKWQYSLDWFWNEKPRIDAILKAKGQDFLIDKFGKQIDQWQRSDFEKEIDAQSYDSLRKAMSDKDDRHIEFLGIDRNYNPITIQQSIERTKEIMNAKKQYYAEQEN